jgi:hypothetical protein
MRKPIDLTIDVTHEVALGVPAHTVATVFLPDEADLADPPILCFAFPGGGYSRHYFSFDMPDSDEGGQAGWHSKRGWIFVACDPLGFGDSTVPAGNDLNFENIALGNRATVEAIVYKLETGSLMENYPAISGATKVAIGQSMGGCFTIVQQGQLGTFDGIATMGFSGVHTAGVPLRPGTTAPFIRGHCATEASTSRRS